MTFDHSKNIHVESVTCSLPELRQRQEPKQQQKCCNTMRRKRGNSDNSVRGSLSSSLQSSFSSIVSSSTTLSSSSLARRYYNGQQRSFGYRSSLSFLSVLFLSLAVVLLSITIPVSESYPLVAVVRKGEKRCFGFNIPADDDAHMVFLGLPTANEIDDPEELLEKWFLEQLYTLTKEQAGGSWKDVRFSKDPPDQLTNKIDKYLQRLGSDNKSGLLIRIGRKNVEPMRYFTYTSKYFAPTVLPSVKKTLPSRYFDRKPEASAAGGEDPAADEGVERKTVEVVDDEALEGYEICLDNLQNVERNIQIMFDVVLSSESPADYENSEVDGASGFSPLKHLTPLEDSLQKSIDAAQKIMTELRSIGSREDRMKKASEKINTRLQFFSIFSVVVLMGVSYIQVSYLHRYFHKKKLL